MKYRFAAVAAGILVLATAVGTAYAHEVEQKGWMIRTQSDCVWNHTELNHGGWASAAGTRIVVESWREQWPGACIQKFDRPPGHLAIARKLLKWNGSSWLNCSSTGWTYNTVMTWTFTGRAVWSSLPCGAGYYNNQGSVQMYNGSWKGGTLNSGSHYLPS